MIDLFTMRILELEPENVAEKDGTTTPLSKSSNTIDLEFAQDVDDTFIADE